MFHTVQDLRTNVMASLAGLLTVLVMAIYAIATYPADGQWLGLAVLLLLGLTVGFIFDPTETAPRWLRVGYLAMMAAVVNILPLLGVTFTAVYVLNFVIAAQSAGLLARRAALIWVALLAVVSFMNLVAWVPMSVAFTQAIALGAGYFAIASFMIASKEADAARRQSQHLLEELQRSHARLQEYTTQAEAFAVAEERNRMAREMHDTLGHRLTVAAVQLEGAQRLIPKNPEKAEQMVGVVRGQVVEGLNELRRTVAALRTPIQDELALDRSILRLAQEFQTATGTTVHLDLPDSLPALDEPIRHALFRTVQEGLTNIQRHAQADQAWISLRSGQDAMVLRIGDDGVGLSQESAKGGYGLRGLAERAADLGGDFRFAPRPDGGTQIEMTLPL